MGWQVNEYNRAVMNVATSTIMEGWEVGQCNEAKLPFCYNNNVLILYGFVDSMSVNSLHSAVFNYL